MHGLMRMCPMHGRTDACVPDAWMDGCTCARCTDGQMDRRHPARARQEPRGPRGISEVARRSGEPQ